MLDRPYCIAVDNHGRVVVGCLEGDVYIFDDGEELVRKVGVSGDVRVQWPWCLCRSTRIHPSCMVMVLTRSSSN